MKKLLSLLLCMTMLAVLVIPAVAATEPEETVWEEESDTIYFEMVTVDPEALEFEDAVIQWQTTPDGMIQWEYAEDEGKVIQVQPSEDAGIQWYPYTDGAIVNEGVSSIRPDMQYQGVIVEAQPQSVRTSGLFGTLVMILLAVVAVLLLGAAVVVGVAILVALIALIVKKNGKKKNKVEETVCEES